jgi:predicted enzyme related to lactoylglutathione lyase
MKIVLSSVFVEDQEKALRFYTGVLGFVKKADVPVGDARWLTVVSPEDPDGPQLLLEPSSNPAAQAFKKALFAQGIPLTAFAVQDVQADYERMLALGVVFHMPPAQTEGTILAVFDDTCGNLIQIFQII